MVLRSLFIEYEDEHMELTVQSSQHATFLWCASFGKVDGCQCRKSAQASPLESPYNYQHRNVDTTCGESTTNNRNNRSCNQRPSTTNMVSDWTTTERSDYSAEKEQCVDCAQNIIRISSTWADSLEIKILIEPGLADRL